MELCRVDREIERFLGVGEAVIWA